MINGGLLFIGFIFVWLVFGVAKDYERQTETKQIEDDTQIENKKEGKRNV